MNGCVYRCHWGVSHCLSHYGVQTSGPVFPHWPNLNTVGRRDLGKASGSNTGFYRLPMYVNN